jgi:hypothetical protein
MNPIRAALDSCQGKAGFASFTLANRVGGAQRKRRESTGRSHPYHCQHCGQWHLGTSSGRPTTRRRLRDLEAANDDE